MNSCCNNPPYYMTAYGLAVKHGYKGTEEEWLQSLNAYVHIKFSHTLPQYNSDMRDAPDAWMGIASTKSPEAPEDFTDYMWLYVKGEADTQILAPAYNEQRTYTVGSVVSFGQGIYKCTAPVTQPEPFDPLNWVQVAMSDLIEEAGNVPDSAVSTDKLTNGAVTTSKLGNGAVTEDKLGSKAVTSDKLGDDSVTNEKVADDAIGTENIQEKAVTSFNLADGSVTTLKLANGAVTTDKLSERSVTGGKLKLDNGDLPTIKLTKGIHYYDTEAEAPTQEGVLSFIKLTD